MALYYFTADYSSEAFIGMVNSPQDREAAARKLIEAVGMKNVVSQFPYMTIATVEIGTFDRKVPETEDQNIRQIQLRLF